MIDGLLTTVAHRPYVAAFLFTFLVLATLHFGILRTLIWFFWGYAVAFLSEWSSIHSGFPYGLYHYLPENFSGELVLAGVPVWDSASYAFIAYASYACAWFLKEPSLIRFQIDPHLSPSKPDRVILLGALLMMSADVVIDPIAHLGKQWFLGQVYYYPNGGLYFDVPLTNFAGWFLVALVILVGFHLMEKHFFTPLKLPSWGAKRFPLQGLLGPLFYFGILGFMLAVTWKIAPVSLSVTSSCITGIILFFVIQNLFRIEYGSGVGQASLKKGEGYEYSGNRKTASNFYRRIGSPRGNTPL